VVLLESVLPLAAAAALAAGTGYGLAAAVSSALAGHSAVPRPGWPYAVTTLAGLAVSVGVILLTLPLHGRLTRTQTARFE
jgi:hypothetical protein